MKLESDRTICLVVIMSVYMLIGICGDARLKERAGTGRGVGSDTGYNFPLFLVYPVDMPEPGDCVMLAACLKNISYQTDSTKIPSIYLVV